MINYLKNNPSRKLNRIILVAGFIIFCPVYYLNYQLVLQLFDTETFTKLSASFDTSFFRDVIESLSQKGQMGDLFNVYLLNIVSVLGFMMIFFSLTLIIARSINLESKIYKLSFIFPLIAIIITVFDILPSFVYLLIAKNPKIVSEVTTYFINGCYVFRVLLLYIEILWIVVMGIIQTIKYIRKRKNEPGKVM